jgi:hypothetical protein
MNLRLLTQAFLNFALLAESCRSENLDLSDLLFSRVSLTSRDLTLGPVRKILPMPALYGLQLPYCPNFVVQQACECISRLLQMPTEAMNFSVARARESLQDDALAIQAVSQPSVPCVCGSLPCWNFGTTDESASARFEFNLIRTSNRNVGEILQNPDGDGIKRISTVFLTMHRMCECGPSDAKNVLSH